MRLPFKFDLVDNWKHILRFAVTIRLAALAGLLSATALIMGVMVSCGSSRAFMALFILVSVCATVVTFLIGPARIIAQPKTMPETAPKATP